MTASPQSLQYALQQIIQRAVPAKNASPKQRKQLAELVNIARNACSEFYTVSDQSRAETQRDEALDALKDLLLAYEHDHPYHKAPVKARETIKKLDHRGLYS